MTPTHIHCAMSLASFTTSLPLQRFSILFSTITLRCPLPPVLAPSRLPPPYLPYFTLMKASGLCHRLTTHTPLIKLCVPINSPDQVIAGSMQDFVTSGIPTSYPTPGTITSVPPRSSTPPLAGAFRLHNAGQKPLDSLNLSSSASSPILDNTLIRGLFLSTDPL
jgi:hypothetical protein